MKKNNMLTILLFVMCFPHSYSQKMPSDYFDEALTYLDSSDYNRALCSFEFIVNNYPKNELYPRAYYNIGYIYYLKEQYDSSIIIFNNIVTGDFENDYKTGPGKGIMSDPYTLYKHSASIMLHVIYFEKKDYTNALKYLVLADKKYPYQHFCGNEIASNGIYMAVQYSLCYEKLNKIDDAINILWNHIFNYGLADNKDAIEQMSIVLPQKYTKEQIITELKNAENTIVIKHKRKRDYATITIFNNEINLPQNFFYFFEGSIKKTKEQKQEEIERQKIEYKNSLFYKTFVY